MSLRTAVQARLSAPRNDRVENDFLTSPSVTEPRTHNISRQLSAEKGEY